MDGINIDDVNGRLSGTALENHFSLGPFAEAVHWRCRVLLGDIPADERVEIVDSALSKAAPLIHSRIFLYHGPYDIDGQRYDIAISPHFYHGIIWDRAYQDRTSPNSYYVMIRSPQDGKLWSRNVHLEDEELENAATIVAKRISTIPDGPILTKQRIFFRQGQLSRRWGNPMREGHVAFRQSRSEELVAKLLEDIRSATTYEFGEDERLLLARTLRDEVASQRNQMWLSFYGKLQPDALDFMASYGEDRTALYNGFVSAPDTARALDFRKGALEVGRRTGQDFSRWTLRRARTFWTSIDAGNSIIVAIADSFDLPEVVVKRFFQNVAGKSYDAAMPSDYASKFFIGDEYYQGITARMLASEPNLPWPKNIHEWHTFERLAAGLRVFFNEGHSISGNKKIAAALMKLWKSSPETKSWQTFSGLYGHRQLHDLSSELGDVLRSMYTKIVLPVVLRYSELPMPEGLETDVRNKIAATLGIRQLIKASEYWHSARVNFSQRLSSASNAEDTTWVPLVNEMEAPNGVIIRPLISAETLLEEGKQMAHCVGSYSSNCLTGRSHIISLMDNQYSRLSTLEIVETTEFGGLRVKINQNKSFHNSDAPDDAKWAADWLVSQINHGDLQTRIDEVREARKKYVFEKEKMRVGFDPLDIQTCEQVRRLYDPCLPDKVRKSCQSGEDFIEVMGITPLLRRRHLLPSKLRSTTPLTSSPSQG